MDNWKVSASTVPGHPTSPPARPPARIALRAYEATINKQPAERKLKLNVYKALSGATLPQ